jgi:solute carrier family 35, member E1
LVPSCPHRLSSRHEYLNGPPTALNFFPHVPTSTMYMNMDDTVSPRSSSAANGLSKFPAFSPDHIPEHHHHESPFPRRSTSTTRDHSPNTMNGAMGDPERWQPRRNSRTHLQWTRSAAFPAPGGARHGRQKSLSEAIRTVRTRGGSMSQNAHEIADALKAPVEPKLIVSPARLGQSN